MEDLLRQTGGRTDAEALAKAGLKIGSNDDISVVGVPLEPGHVAVVSDGVGGEIGGSIASRNAVNGAMDAVHDFSAQRGVAFSAPEPVRVFDPAAPISDISFAQPSVATSAPQPQPGRNFLNEYDEVTPRLNPETGQPEILVKIGPRDESLAIQAQLEQGGIPSQRSRFPNSDEYYLRVPQEKWQQANSIQLTPTVPTNNSAQPRAYEPSRPLEVAPVETPPDLQTKIVELPDGGGYATRTTPGAHSHEALESIKDRLQNNGVESDLRISKTSGQEYLTVNVANGNRLSEALTQHKVEFTPRTPVAIQPQPIPTAMNADPRIQVEDVRTFHWDQANGTQISRTVPGAHSREELNAFQQQLARQNVEASIIPSTSGKEYLAVHPDNKLYLERNLDTRIQVQDNARVFQWDETNGTLVSRTTPGAHSPGELEQIRNRLQIQNNVDSAILTSKTSGDQYLAVHPDNSSSLSDALVRHREVVPAPQVQTSTFQKQPQQQQQSRYEPNAADIADRERISNEITAERARRMSVAPESGVAPEASGPQPFNKNMSAISESSGGAGLQPTPQGKIVLETNGSSALAPKAVPTEPLGPRPLAPVVEMKPQAPTVGTNSTTPPKGELLEMPSKSAAAPAPAPRAKVLEMPSPTAPKLVIEPKPTPSSLPTEVPHPAAAPVGEIITPSKPILSVQPKIAPTLDGSIPEIKPPGQLLEWNTKPSAAGRVVNEVEGAGRFARFARPLEVGGAFAPMALGGIAGAMQSDGTFKGITKGAAVGTLDGAVDMDSLHKAFDPNQSAWERWKHGAMSATAATATGAGVASLSVVAAPVAAPIALAAGTANMALHVEDGFEKDNRVNHLQIKHDAVMQSIRPDYKHSHLQSIADQTDQQLKATKQPGLIRNKDGQIDLHNGNNQVVLDQVIKQSIKANKPAMEQTDQIDVLPGAFKDENKFKTHVQATEYDKVLRTAASELNTLKLDNGMNAAVSPAQMQKDYAKMVAADKVTVYQYGVKDAEVRNGKLKGGTFTGDDKNPTIPDNVKKQFAENPETSAVIYQVVYKPDAHGKPVPDGVVGYMMRVPGLRQSAPFEPIILPNEGTNAMSQHPQVQITAPVQPKPQRVKADGTQTVNVTADSAPQIETTFAQLNNLIDEQPLVSFNVAPSLPGTGPDAAADLAAKPGNTLVAFNEKLPDGVIQPALPLASQTLPPTSQLAQAAPTAPNPVIRQSMSSAPA